MEEVKRLTTLKDGRQFVISNFERENGGWVWRHELKETFILYRSEGSLVFYFKVLASSFPLEGIPQFDPINIRMERLRREAEKLALEKYPDTHLITSRTPRIAVNSFIEGYLSATKYRFTKEDMIEYKVWCKNDGVDYFWAGGIPYTDEELFNEWLSQRDEEVFVEFEMEEIKIGITDDGNNYITELQPKLTNGKLTLIIK